MKTITLYSFKTKERKIIPMAELAPGHIKVRLMGDGEPDEIVWIDTKELAGKQRELRLRQPPFDNAHKEIFRQLKKSLDEVYPQTLEQWELGFRCDTKPEYEIAKWRWLAETYTRLTDPRLWKKHHSAPSQPVKQDIFRLLHTWNNVGDVSEVLATTLPFEELSEDETRQILEYCKVIPAEFFGGNLAVILRLFGIVAGNEPLQLPDTMFGTGRSHLFLQMFDGVGERGSTFFVIDHAAIKALADFKAKAETAEIILAVDWATGDTQIVYGIEALGSLSKPTRFKLVAFAVNFESEMLEHLLAAVQVTKGHYYYNGERHDLPEQ